LALIPSGPAAVHAASTVTVSTCDESNLRSAITSAGAGGTVTFSCSGTITLASTITIGQDLSIDGSGQAVKISGGHSVQVFVVSNGEHLTLNQLSITDGSLPFANGGGILNEGTLSVTNSTFSGNVAATDGGTGGGIANEGTLSVAGSTFSGNFGYFSGGGIYNTGTLSVTGTTFSGNSAQASGGGAIENDGGTLSVANSTFSGNSMMGAGGGIRSDGGTLIVTDSTFIGNYGDSGGGAIENDSGTLIVTNSTFSGNGAGNLGGGVRSDSGALIVTNSTFSGNSAAEGGGGIYSFGTLSVSNTIMANSPAGGNCLVANGSTFSDGGGNLDDGSSCGFSAANHSLSATNPQLLALAENGGPPQTMAPAPTSPAIGLGLASTCLSTGPTGVNNLDQRGQPRHADTRGVCDSGAYDTGGSVSDTDLSLANVPTNVTTVATSPDGAVVTYTPPTAMDEAGDSPPPVVGCIPPSGSTFPIGTTTVTCSTTDTGDTPNSVSATFAVTVKGAVTQIEELNGHVGGLPIDHGLITSLDAQLRAALADLQANHTAPACGVLVAFINHVEAQSGKGLTTTQTNQLQAEAANIRQVLGC
jgi:predicted outer membrane repeat protein